MTKRHVLGSIMLHNLHDTEMLGQAIASRLPPQAVIGLNGTLGAGKTRLVQAITQAVGIGKGVATSPTFTLIQPYQSDSQTIYHVDTYRVSDIDEFLELGIEELMEESAWVIVEWADRMAEVFPETTLWIEIDLLDSETRQVTFSGEPTRWATIVQETISHLTR